MAILNEHYFPRDYFFPGTKVWVLSCAGLLQPKIIQGEIAKLTYNEMGEMEWWYYVAAPKRSSQIICTDPLIKPPASRGMMRNYVYLTKEEALFGAESIKKETTPQ